jgi:hypothetical protein
MVLNRLNWLRTEPSGDSLLSYFRSSVFENDVVVFLDCDAGLKMGTVCFSETSASTYTIRHGVTAQNNNIVSLLTSYAITSY